MALTLILYCASSSAAIFIKATWPALVVLYAENPIFENTRLPLIELLIRMLPPFSFICGIAYLTVANVPRRLI
ncbi:hypothetical protein D3C74_466240 [compost metagenome]